ncbi:CHRD domain-containing protein [Roseovarius dicentrarchi]|uniref:CHRD domain-containing protein n=1 Tax=Roseovarius dicentrarchi TaxID=2250573 RepID=UPI000DE9BE73|nr:CHRD domain-containing protein [Roseovarius dicentrarchi]
MFMPNVKYTALAAAACAALAIPASAETITYTADLTAGAEVPPNDSGATGTADVTVDTEAKTVAWTVEYDGLTGDATAAHIHGPAAEGENAGPVITMSDINEGEAEITDEQIAELEDGKYYVNIHTEQNPDGEIRGQLTKAD